MDDATDRLCALELPDRIELLFDREQLAEALRLAHCAVNDVYVAAAEARLDPDVMDRAAAASVRLARNIEDVWMANMPVLEEERDIRCNDALERSVDSQTLLHVSKCLCLVNVVMCSCGRAKIVDAITATELPAIARQDLVMARGPVLGYTVSELHGALLSLTARWRELDVVKDVEVYFELLELRYGVMLRCLMPVAVHDVKDYRKFCGADTVGADGASRVPGYACSEAMRGEMAALCGGITDALWTRHAFDRAPAECDVDETARLMRALDHFCETTKSAEELQRSYAQWCALEAVRPGECAAFAPENPLYSVTSHNAMIRRRGPKTHAAMQQIALAPIRSVFSSALAKARAADALAWNEDVAVLCTADMFFRQYRVVWAEAFVVRQPDFRAKASSFLPGLPPVVFADCNRYNVFYGGRLLVTPCVFASIALWTRLLRAVFDGDAHGRDLSVVCDYVTGHTAVMPGEVLSSATAGASGGGADARVRPVDPDPDLVIGHRPMPATGVAAATVVEI